MSTLEIMLSALTSLLGTGWALHYKIDKRRRKAEVKSVELDVDAKHDELQDRQLDNCYTRIEKLQKIVDTERNKWSDIARELIDTKVELLKEREARKIAEHDKCTRERCELRIPPRNIKLIQESYDKGNEK